MGVTVDSDFLSKIHEEISEFYIQFSEIVGGNGLLRNAFHFKSALTKASFDFATRADYC